jgi:phytol kinase
MPPLTDLALIPVSIASLLGVMLMVRVLGGRFLLRPELQRKLVHVSTGLYALTLPFTFQSTASVLILIALSLVVLSALRLPTFAHSGIGAAVHAVGRKSYGEIYLALSVGLIFWLSGGQLILYVLPILVLTLSDAAAALAGTRYGSRHFQVEAGSKSWEGVAMFFMVTLIISMTLLLLMSDIGRANVVVLSAIIAAFGALVEADSWGGLDNLFVPTGLYLLLASHLDTPPGQLAILAAAFTATLIMLMQAAPRLGLEPHAARAYVVLIFLICAATAPHNAILPVGAVLAHIATRAVVPCRSAYPHLDMVAVSAGAGLFWLFAGEFFSRNALNVYNLTFASMAVLYISLALQKATLLVRLVTVGVLTCVVAAILLQVASHNVKSFAWHGALVPWMLASLALAAAAGLSAPALFERFRSVRVLMVAAPIPLLLFIMKGLMP